MALSLMDNWASAALNGKTGPVFDSWGTGRDGLRVGWSPAHLWIEMGGESFVVVYYPTYGDVRRLLKALRIRVKP